ncbi:hypothetical protein AAC387_Pa03g2789 [Persea americana]
MWWKRLFWATIAIAVLSIFLAPNSLHPFSSSQSPIAFNSPQNSELLPITGAVGPESLAWDIDGRGPYTGVSNGRIIRWREEEHVWDEFAVTSPQWRAVCQESQQKLEHICGRPLGLRFHEKTGELYIADAYFGLCVVGREGGQAMPVATKAQGMPFGFTNALDIDRESGVIYFSDSSIRFQRREFMSAIISGDNTGRIMKYDPQSKQTTVLLDGLSFPNGVALSKDGSFLLIAETTSCRILRLWLQTSKAGTSDVLAHLPGFPDNIKRNPRGDFWVALHSKRGNFLNWLLSISWLRKVSHRLLGLLNFSKIHTYFVRLGGNDGLALRLNEEGEVLEVLDGGAKIIRPITEVEERDGRLWIGSLDKPFVGVYKL